MSLTVEITKSEQALLDQIDVAGSQMIAQVKSWSNINSGSTNIDGLNKQRALIIESFNELGGIVDEPELPTTKAVDSSGNVYEIEHARAYRLVQRADAPIQILLTGHYDTVFAKDSEFQSVVSQGDDALNGPGVADMKGGLLVMRQALLALEQHENTKNVGYTVLISPDEEIGSTGSAGLLKQHAQKADLGMTYEPSLADGSLSGARKGSGNFSIVIKGKSAHAGREHHLGRNALVVAASVITKLAAMSGARSGLTVNPAKLDGGGANNVVPDLAVVRFNARLLETEDMLWFDAELKKIVV